jgi:DNA-binding GntR family transcriptional regulator
MIDALAARLAARRGLDDATRRRMKSLLERMETFAADPKPDIAAYAEALADFRLAIMAASGNSRLAEFASLVRISTQLQLVKFMQSGLDGIPSNSVPDALHVTIERQRALFAALVDGDAEHAQALATQYAARTLQYLQTLPDPEDAAESDRAAG